MKHTPLRAVIFGPQGSGKGTQGNLLSIYFGVPLIGSGDIFRAEIRSLTPLGRVMKEYVEAGLLVPDELTDALMQKQFRNLKVDKGFILDGYPRNVEQAAYLDKLVKINLSLQIKISDEESVRRLQGRRQCPDCRTIFHIEVCPPRTGCVCDKCGHELIKRNDDEESVIRARLEGYHFMTEPLASYYRQRGVLLAVKGEQSIHSLYEESVRKMSKLGFVPPRKRAS